MGPEQRAVILIYIPTWASAKEGILIKINARGGGPIYSPQTADNIQFYLLRIEIPKFIKCDLNVLMLLWPQSKLTYSIIALLFDQKFYFFENFQIQKKKFMPILFEKKSGKRKFAVERAKRATYTSSI